MDVGEKTRKMLELEEEYKKDIVDLICDLFKELGTQRAVAWRLGLHESTLSYWCLRLGISFERIPKARTTRTEGGWEKGRTHR